MQTLEILLDMFKKENKEGAAYDAFIVMQAMRYYV
jgi:hypothetical protein